VRTRAARRPAQELFRGQNNAKSKKKIVRLEQRAEVQIVDGKTITTLFRRTRS